MTSPYQAAVAALRPQMERWRHDLHRIPELGYEEKLTSDYVAGVLAGLGYQTIRGIGGTGLVATRAGVAKGGGLAPPVALRADMDALPISEAPVSEVQGGKAPCRSLHEGRMHACGHDGHMAMLLGAAACLSRLDPPGDVHFLFQPAEETGAGAQAMIRDGLFDLIGVSAIYGLHNWPGLPEGSFHACDGPQMAAYDFFDIEVEGKGCHAALPHMGRDPLLAASRIVDGLQGIVAREIDPLDNVVISVTQIHGGDAYNVIPGMARISGCTRSLSAAGQQMVERRMAEMVPMLAAASGCSARLEYRRGYPLTVNSAAGTGAARAAARRAFGDDLVEEAPRPVMASEDFSYFLGEKPGCYAFLGAGPPVGGAGLHNEGYRFNDRILTCGALWWVELAMGRAGDQVTG